MLGICQGLNSQLWVLEKLADELTLDPDPISLSSIRHGRAIHLQAVMGGPPEAGHDGECGNGPVK
jgi:hypothetical protein